MGGMSSLSFDNMFSPDGANRPEGTARPAPEGRIARLPVEWTEPLHRVIATQGATRDASSWALSGMRRVLDCVVAAVALFAFLPVMALAALLVRLGSPGTVFFRQRRMGRNGSEFTLYKFRSMDPRGGRDSCITVSGDSRITPVGALLRRYKLDELPQFWNVLRGDMGLVGPRPKLPHHEALHMVCRPGITGAATLAFRNEEEFLAAIPGEQLEAFYELFVKPAKAQLDLEYMRTATLTSDLKVLWRTAAACFFSDESMVQSAEMIAQYERSRKEWAKRAPGGAGYPMAVPRVYSAGVNSEL